MKKTLFIILFLVFILNAYTQNEFHFGNYQWGTEIDIIKLNEGVPNSESIWGFGRYIHDIVYNNRTVEGHTAEIKYQFFKNKLHFGRYDFIDIYTLDLGIEIYVDLINTLNNIYGKDRLHENTTNEQIIRWIRHNFENRETDIDMIDGSEIKILAQMSWDHSRGIDFIDTVRNNWTYININFVYYNELQKFAIDIIYTSPDYHENMQNIYGR
jgi:hypothetical protein